MSKTIEIPEIAQYEETDSELAKYSIQRLSSLIKNQEDQLKANNLMINDLLDRIIKAIKYIEKEPIDDEIEYTTRLLDILRGEDIKEIPQFEGTLEQLDKLSIRGNND